MLQRKLVVTNVQLNLPNVTKDPFLFRGLFCGDQLTEVFCEKETAFTPIGTICIGRVENIVPSINGLFLRISDNELAYLPKKEIDGCIFSKKTSKQDVCIGDEILVQVCKEPIKTKGATVTTRLQLAGKYMVLTLETNTVQVSKKITGESRKELKNYFDSLKENSPLEDTTYGIIVRTNASYVNSSVLEEEFASLHEHLASIIKTGIHKSMYTKLYMPESTLIQRIRDFLPEDEIEIITDLPSIYEQINNANVLDKNLTLRLYEDDYSLDKLYSVSSNLEKALSTKVWLKSGAYLIIEPTEALTVIDVNSGKNIKNNKNNRYYLDINLEAADEILYQLELRNISGIVVVDFIDMPNPKQINELIDHLNSLCKKQRIPTSFVEITKLNLAHIIRKKVHQPLREQVKE